MIQKRLAPVISVEPLPAPGHFVLTFDAGPIAVDARPGHFVAISDPTTGAQILRKPFSIYTADPDSGRASILFSVYGPTTRAMSGYGPGSTLDLIGPLGGRVFQADPRENCHHVLVGGGYGVPPLAFFARTLKRARPNLPVTLIHGARNAAFLVGADGLPELGATVLATTDDGSVGLHGKVTDVLAPLLKTGEPIHVYTCGPTPMMRAVAHLCDANGVPCQVSMETFMPCGIGICVGCVIERPDGTFSRTCTDGPVYPSTEVIW